MYAPGFEKEEVCMGLTVHKASTSVTGLQCYISIQTDETHSLKEFYQITCSFLCNHKRLYTLYHIRSCTPHDL